MNLPTYWSMLLGATAALSMVAFVQGESTNWSLLVLALVSAVLGAIAASLAHATREEASTKPETERRV